MELHPYQTEAVEFIRESFKSHRSVLYVGQTGSGKTVLTAYLLKKTLEKGNRAIFLCHRKEIIDQTSRTFREFDIDHGIVCAGYAPNYNSPIQIASVQSVGRRLKHIKNPKLLVTDECQHIAAKTWEKIYKSFPDAFKLGLTATPQRLDGSGLRKFFSHMIQGPSVQTLIDDGFLSPYRAYAPPSVNLSDVRKKMRDFVAGDLEKIMTQKKIIGDTIQQYQRFVDGKQTLVFCPTIYHSKVLTQRFTEAGYDAVHVDGTTPKSERAHYVSDFSQNKIKIMCSVDIFSEGFDVPRIEAVLLTRSTMSLGLFRQQVGRALRVFPGKREAIIMDQVGNIERHGLPCDLIEWSLDGKSKNKEPSNRICPQCFYANNSGKSVCDGCGYIWPISSEKTVLPTETEDNLEEIDIARIRKIKKHERGSARTLEQLVQLGISRGYKSPRGWAMHVLNARRNKYS
jgi:superfamily II DNA or RNA helicase